MRTFPLILDENRRHALLATGLVAAVTASGLLWATRFLETKWLIPLLAGGGVLWAALVSCRFERVMKALLFLIIPVNVDIHFDVGRSLSAFTLPVGTPRLGISTIDILLGFLYVTWFFRWLLNRHTETIHWPPGATAFVCFLGWAALSMINATSRLLSVFLLVGFFKAFLLFFYVANNLRTRDDLSLVVRCLIAGLLFESLFACVQQAVGRNLGLPVLGERLVAKEVELGGDKVFRVGGTLGHPNFLGGYLVTVLPLALGMSVASVKGRGRFFFAGSFLLGSLVLVLTYSRSAWVTALISCLVLVGYLFFREPRRVRFAPLLVLIVGLGLVGSLFAPLVQARWREDDRGSTSSRIPQMQMAWSMIKQHPLLGVGLNNHGILTHRYEAYVENTADTRRVFRYSRIHNIFLAIAAETGLIGISFILWYLIVTMVRGFRTILTAPDDTVRLTLLGMALGLLARLPHDAFHTGDLAANSFFWIYPACLVAGRLWRKG